MGYTTDFIGHLNIDPPLNAAEQEYLTGFSASRRHRRPDGPYEVPGTPSAERGHGAAVLDAYNAVASGQPSLWCGWVPSWDGCCLAHDGIEKFYASTVITSLSPSLVRSDSSWICWISVRSIVLAIFCLPSVELEVRAGRRPRVHAMEFTVKVAVGVHHQHRAGGASDR